MARSAINYVNLAAFVINTFFTFATQTGIFGGKSNSELSEKYQTLITPAGWAFSIWGVIFTTEGIAMIAQLTDRFADSPLLVNSLGTSYAWTVACVAQAAWSLLFSHELILMSQIAITTIMFALAYVVYSAAAATASAVNAHPTPLLSADSPMKGTNTPSGVEVALLSLPFRLHYAWLTIATIVNANVLTVERGHGSTDLLTSAIVSLVVYALLVGGQLRHVSALGLVAAWSLFAIHSELSSPKDSITATFSQEVIAAVRDGSHLVAVPLLVVSVGVALWNTVAFLRRDRVTAVHSSSPYISS